MRVMAAVHVHVYMVKVNTGVIKGGSDDDFKTILSRNPY